MAIRILKAVGLVLLILLPVLVWLLWPSDASRIRKLIKTTAEAAQRRDIERVIEAVSLQYSDEHGLSYLSLRKLLEREFKRLTYIKVEYRNLLVEVRGEAATATMDITITAASEGEEPRIISGGGGTEPTVLHLKLVKGGTGRWAVKSALWPPGFSYLNLSHNQ